MKLFKKALKGVQKAKGTEERQSKHRPWSSGTRPEDTASPPAEPSVTHSLKVEESTSDTDTPEPHDFDREPHGLYILHPKPNLGVARPTAEVEYAPPYSEVSGSRLTRLVVSLQFMA